MQPTGSTISKVHVLEGYGATRYLFPYLMKLQKTLRTLKDNANSLSTASPASNPVGAKHRVSGSPRRINVASDAAEANSAHAAPGNVEAALLRGEGGLPFFPCIPETVIYEHNFPQAWYAYDVKSKELSKNSGKFLDVQEIFKGFSTVEEGCGDICAQFVGILRTSDASGDHTDELPTGSTKAHSVVESCSTEVLYFTPERLLAWLKEKDPLKPKEGILQKFVAPRGERNDCLQVVWSPTMSTLRRRTNIHPLDSMRVDGRTKCSTFDALPHLCDESQGNESVKRTICDSLAIVASQLLKAEHKLISRIVLHLKHDRNNVLWMLYATSMRVENAEIIGSCVVRDPLELDTMYHQPPSQCSNGLIATALSLTTTMEPAVGCSSTDDRWKAFNSVHRDSTDESRQHSVQRSSMSKRRDTKVLLDSALQWQQKSVPSSVPLEIAALSQFIEDTLYVLYAARMTTNRNVADPLVLVHLPHRLREFLDANGTEELLNGILQMEEVILPRPPPSITTEHSGVISVSIPQQQTHHTYRLRRETKKRPLCIVRNECERFLRDVRAIYE